MTVGELREKLASVPADTKIGISFPETLDTGEIWATDFYIRPPQEGKDRNRQYVEFIVV